MMHLAANSCARRLVRGPLRAQGSCLKRLRKLASRTKNQHPKQTPLPTRNRTARDLARSSTATMPPRLRPSPSASRPGRRGKPGARDAGVLNYIDLALAGAYADLQDFYRRGLAQLDQYCRETHREPFVHLSTGQQDAVITALEEGKATGFTWPTAQEFFNTLRTHTMEGMFADPLYGGNKDFAGWRLVGFPGAQPIFTRTDMQSKQAFI